MTITGCARCGKTQEGMEITLFKGNPLCEDCFKIECPPITSVMCSFRCGKQVSDPVELTKRQPLCEDCKTKQHATVVELKMTMDRAKVVDDSIQVRADIFNAQTVAIVELQQAIQSDDSIQNKPYALAETLRNRFEHLRNVVFELNEKIAEAGSEQRAIQTYLNTLANTLRTEEREKLRISDINYKPQPVKTHTVRQVKTTGTSVKKASKKEISAAARELGIAEFTLSAFVLQSGGNLEVAVSKIKASIAAAQQSK